MVSIYFFGLLIYLLKERKISHKIRIAFVLVSRSYDVQFQLVNWVRILVLFF